MVTLEVKIGDAEGMMNFCIPYVTIEAIVSKLSTQFWYSSVRRSATSRYTGILKEKLSTVAIDVISEMGSIDLTVRDVLNLRVGDVIQLPDVHIGDPFTLSVGNRKKFYCQPGVVGKKIAVQILEKIEEIEEDELIADGEDLYE